MSEYKTSETHVAHSDPTIQIKRDYIINMKRFKKSKTINMKELTPEKLALMESQKRIYRKVRFKNDPEIVDIESYKQYNIAEEEEIELFSFIPPQKNICQCKCFIY